MEIPKKHTIRMSAETARRLKVMAAAVEMSQGELLKALLAVHRDSPLTDQEYEDLKVRFVEYLCRHPQAGPR